jgi:hypothetical protein
MFTSGGELSLAKHLKALRWSCYFSADECLDFSEKLQRLEAVPAFRFLLLHLEVVVIFSPVNHTRFWFFCFLEKVLLNNFN